MHFILDHDKTPVLVVEDNPVFIEVIRTLFHQNEVPLIIAQTGIQALNLLRHPHFASLIVDLNLPDYSGIDLLAKIRALEHYQHTAITVFTAEDLNPSRLRNIHEYANQVVLKSPQAIADLCLQAKHVLQQQVLNNMLSEPEYQWHAHDYQKGQLNDVSVLLVDDDERNLYSLSQALEQEGMSVMTAESGREALDILANNDKIQIVLLDIMMPTMDGYQVLKTLRHSSELPQLPVIALTAKAMLGDKEKCLAAGASAYLSKPLEMQSLFTCIASHVFDEQDLLIPS